MAEKAKATRGPVATWARRITFGAAAVVVVWVGDNVLLREKAPAPLFRESDLPMPAAADDGWMAFRDADQVRAVEIPRELVALTDPRDADTKPRPWAEVVEKKDAIAAFVASAEGKRAADTMLAAIAKPAFLDACPIDFEARCAHFALHRAHQAAELAILDRALAGRRADALKTAAQLVRADASFVGSYRTLISEMIALGCAERSLTLVSLLLSGPEGEALDPAVAGELRAALDSMRGEAIDLRRGVMGEYIAKTKAIDFLERESGGMGIATRVFLDRGQTERFVAESLQPALAYAADASAPPPPAEPVRIARDALWWFHNPIGKLMVDRTGAALGSLLTKAHRHRDSIVRQRDAARARLAALAK